jgi:hypothetical protein
MVHEPVITRTTAIQATIEWQSDPDADDDESTHKGFDGGSDQDDEELDESED